MHVRLINDIDLPHVALMNRQLIEDEHSENTLDLAGLEQRLVGFLDRGWKIVICEEDDVPVGYATFFVGNDDLDPSRARVNIGHFFIRRERRAMGRGTAFFSQLQQDFFPSRAKIVLDVLVGNTNAQSFYRSLGFAEYSIMMEKR